MLNFAIIGGCYLLAAKELLSHCKKGNTLLAFVLLNLFYMPVAKMLMYEATDRQLLESCLATSLVTIGSFAFYSVKRKWPSGATYCLAVYGPVVLFVLTRSARLYYYFGIFSAFRLSLLAFEDDTGKLQDPIGAREYFAFATYLPALLWAGYPLHSARNFFYPEREDQKPSRHFKPELLRCAVGFIKVTVVAPIFMQLTLQGNPRYGIEARGGAFSSFALLFLMGFLAVVCIYVLFTGKVDLIISISRMIGIRIDENFNHSYLARGWTDLWRRFNIMTGRYHLKVVYQPVAHWIGRVSGLRTTQLPSALALLVTFLSVALWHESGFLGLLFAAMQAVMISIESAFFRLVPKSRKPSSLSTAAGWLWTLFFWCLFSMQVASLMNSLFLSMFPRVMNWIPAFLQ